jgi:hypothetical protein
MTHHIILKGKDSFQKEEERDFGISGVPYTYRTRHYERIESLPITKASEQQSPLYQDIRTIDREFLLRSQFYALGKNIAYYEEN